MQSQFYQAIRTRWHGPTNIKGSRISARAEAGSIIVNYDHRLSLNANHEAAARKLVAKLGWIGPQYGDLVGGVLPNGDYVFVKQGAK